MIVAGALAPNMRQAISNHHVDLTLVILRDRLCCSHKTSNPTFFSYWWVCILMLMTCQWKLVQIQDWMLVWKPVYNHLYVELPFILFRNIDLTFTSIWWTRSASKFVLHELSCAELVSGMLHCAKRLSEAMRAFCQWAHCKRHCDFSENGKLLL